MSASQQSMFEIKAGDTFGRREVLEVGLRHKGYAACRARCACGTVAVVMIRSIRTALSCSRCGGQRKHGMYLTPEYRAWQTMIQRCYKPQRKGYPNYGGRGIEVWHEWRSPGGFERFFAYVGLKPTPKHTLDRIDCDGNYEPGNVRWATRVEQNQNMRSNVNFEINGAVHCLTEWCRIYKVSINAVRYYKLRMAPKVAFLHYLKRKGISVAQNLSAI